MGWQPINTAPKDGTQILVPIGRDVLCVVSWWDGAWREGTNGLRPRNEPAVWHALPALPEDGTLPSTSSTKAA